jgi:hypothetical protein
MTLTRKDRSQIKKCVSSINKLDYFKLKKMTPSGDIMVVIPTSDGMLDFKKNAPTTQAYKVSKGKYGLNSEIMSNIGVFFKQIDLSFDERKVKGNFASIYNFLLNTDGYSVVLSEEALSALCKNNAVEKYCLKTKRKSLPKFSKQTPYSKKVFCFENFIVNLGLAFSDKTIARFDNPSATVFNNTFNSDSAETRQNSASLKRKASASKSKKRSSSERSFNIPANINVNASNTRSSTRRGLNSIQSSERRNQMRKKSRKGSSSEKSLSRIPAQMQNQSNVNLAVKTGRNSRQKRGRSRKNLPANSNTPSFGFGSLLNNSDNRNV